MIEAKHFEITRDYCLMTSEELSKGKPNENNFWHHATKYTSSGIVDKLFVNEIAYLMVTLYRTGA